jgi:hypothetical protein
LVQLSEAIEAGVPLLCDISRWIIYAEESIGVEIVERNQTGNPFADTRMADKRWMLGA